MNKAETAELLTLAAAVDQRTIGEADVEAWLLLIGGMPFDQARRRLIWHYQHHARRMWPADIINPENLMSS